MKLAVGILRYEQGWEILLNQIGVPWGVCSDGDLAPEAYTVVIINGPPTTEQRTLLSSFLNEGGSLLSTFGFGSVISGGSVRNQRYRSLVPERFPIFPAHDVIDVFAPGRTEYFRDAMLQSPTVSVSKMGRGTIASLPFDCSSLILDSRSMRKNFYSGTKRLPSEIVSTVSKGGIRKTVTSALEYLFHQRGVPFVHKWYFPENHPTLFTFRVDSDKGSHEETMALYSLCEKHKVRTAWFLDTKSHESWLGEFRTFKRQEIGIHCYNHRTYGSYEENFHNFSKAHALLKSIGITPLGAAAPYGTWNGSVAKAFEHLHLQYSSEFSLNYDDLPFYPSHEGKLSSVLQIPIHPICTGSMRRSGYSSDDMIAYFRAVIDKKIEEREPICLYHHPTHHDNAVFENLFRYLGERRIQNISYADYASWWRRRQEYRIGFDFDRKKQSITPDPKILHDDVRWRLSFPNGTESIIPMRRKLTCSSLSTKKHAVSVHIPRDIARIRRFDWLHAVNDILQWWYKRSV